MAGPLSPGVLAMIRLVKRLPLPLPPLCAFASAAEQRPGPPAQMSVSAMSSGAVMANQPHIAHSAEIMGAAMIASGLYGCAALHAIADGVGAQASQAAGPSLSTPVNSPPHWRPRLGGEFGDS
jgi:hypothetical protein